MYFLSLFIFFSQCIIDLGKNQLQIGTTGTVTPFLGEGDLPEHARLNTVPSSTDGDKELAEALSRSAKEAGKTTVHGGLFFHLFYFTG